MKRMSLKDRDFSGNSELDIELDSLFAAYRRACPDPEPSASFTPALWQAIDARRGFALSFGRWARGLATAAAALAMLAAIFVALPTQQTSPVYLVSYVESLDSANSLDTMAYAEIAESSLQ